MPKPQKRNAFWYFMLDFKKREEASGKKFPAGFKEIQSDARCSEEWNKLSADKKREYQNRAKRNGNDSANKLTTTGDAVAVLEERKRKQLKFEENMKAEIVETFNIADGCSSIPQLSFFMIHVNHFYTKIALDSTVDYFPAEYAVIEFSLQEGQKRNYHQIVQTKFELGYSREAMEHSNATHKLSENMEGENDFEVMYKKLVNFLQGDGKITDKLPPIYTTSKCMTIVPCLFERMTKAANAPDNTFSLYSLDYLFGTMMRYCNTSVALGCNSSLIAESELEKGAFSYTPDIECVFHKSILDSSLYCSLAIVRTWVFTICDYCCKAMDLEMFPGLHMPHDSYIPKLSRVSSLASSMQSLSVRDYHLSAVNSATGVSERYTIRSQRSHAEERIRRENNVPLTIIDHSKIIGKSSESISVPSAAKSTSQPERKTIALKPLRPPNTVSQALMGNTQYAPELNNSNFPAIGGGRGRGAAIDKGSGNSQLQGRGRGGIPLD